jgi:asparagine synthase (glutamine-hydrolysing)
MLRSIKHGGPDDEGIFSDDSVALGTRRLAIVDAEHGNQPMHNEDETVWIAFNGEIYNFAEIKDELARLGHKFDTDTDTETVVHAYEEWDTGCVRKFNGMFAFALWDKIRRRLFLARDRIGIKPLYYCGRSDRFLFGSEIKALVLDPEVPRKPNDHVIYDFLTTGHQSHRGDTFFADIKELPPGHCMTIDENQLSVKRYWNLVISTPIESKGDEYYASKFLELLSDAIKIRLPKNMAIGSFLSGGLDSTSIVCLANKILKTNLLSNNMNYESQELFSAYYHETAADERPFIEEASRFLSTKINYVSPSSTMEWSDIKKFVYYMDEPVTVLNYYVYWCLARIAKEQVKVTFSGQGPDEFLAGHTDHFETYVRELLKKKRIRRLFVELVASLNRYGFVSVIRRAIAMLMLRATPAEGLLNPRFVASHKMDRIRRKNDSLNAALLRDVTQNRLPMHLRVGDRVSSAFSTEARCPYLDHRIIEFSFSLPETQKIKNAWTKYVLRNAVKGLIPESVRKRKKSGTPIPLERWMRDFHEEIKGVFSSNKFRERGYFNHAAILDAYERYCNGKLGRREHQLYGDVLWRILNVELWLEIFFDQKNTVSLQNDPATEM